MSKHWLLFTILTLAVICQAKDKKNAAASDPVFVGAGDIASCDDLSGAYATAALIEKIPGTVFALGDKLHFRRDDALAGTFELRHNRFAFLRRHEPDQVRGV